MRQIVDYMIGDWVKVNGTPRQVSAIHPKKIGFHITESRLDWARFDRVTKISLTTELLLKNGFQWTKEGTLEFKIIAGDGTFRVDLEDIGDGLWNMELLDTSRFSEEKIKKEAIEKFLGLHHLQHEFNEAGIKKEWKI